MRYYSMKERKKEIKRGGKYKEKYGMNESKESEEEQKTRWKGKERKKEKMKRKEVRRIANYGKNGNTKKDRWN